jgi:hypothetical protein
VPELKRSIHALVGGDGAGELQQSENSPSRLTHIGLKQAEARAAVMQEQGCLILQ